jgi:hypothetical protein
MDVARSYINQLNAVTQQLESKNGKDQRQCVQNILAFLESIHELGSTPAQEMGMHVCSNVMVLVADHFVKPALMHGGVGSAGGRKAGAATARQDVTRPLRSLVDALHVGVDADAIAPPFTWKNGRPLAYLLRHAADVLNSEALVGRFGQDYAYLILRLLDFEAYTEIVTPAYVTDLVERLVVLLSAPDQVEADEMVAYGLALARLVQLPQWSSGWAMAADRINAVNKIALLVDRHHHSECSKSSLRGHAALLRAAATVVRLAAGEEAELAVTDGLVGALRKAIDVWHTTMRKDAWRTDLLHTVAVVVGVAFHRNVPDRAFTTVHLRFLHQTVFPWCVGVLDASRCEFGFVTGDDLWRFRNRVLTPATEAMAFMLHVLLRTTGAFVEVIEGGGGAGTGDRPLKRNRSVTPLETLRDRCKAFSTLGGTSLSDSSAMWLQTLSVPVATASLAPGDHRDVVHWLADALKAATAQYEQPLLGALMPLLGAGAPLDVQQSLWTLTAHRAAPHVATEDVSLIDNPMAARIFFLTAMCQGACEELPTLRLPVSRLLRRLDPGVLRLIASALTASSDQVRKSAAADCAAASAHVIPAVAQLFSVLNKEDVPKIEQSVRDAAVLLQATFGGQPAHERTVTTGETPLISEFEFIVTSATVPVLPRGNGTGDADRGQVSATAPDAGAVWLPLLQVLRPLMAPSVDTAVTCAALLGLLAELLARCPLPTNEDGANASDSDDEVIVHQRSKRSNVAAVVVETPAARLEKLLAGCVSAMSTFVSTAAPTETARVLTVLTTLVKRPSFARLLASPAVTLHAAPQMLLDALGTFGRRVLDLVRSAWSWRPANVTSHEIAACVRSVADGSLSLLGHLCRSFEVAHVHETAADPLVDWNSLATFVHVAFADAKLLGDDAGVPQSIVPRAASSIVPAVLALTEAPRDGFPDVWRTVGGLLRTLEIRFGFGNTHTLLEMLARSAPLSPETSGLRATALSTAAAILSDSSANASLLPPAAAGQDASRDRPPTSAALQVAALEVISHVIAFASSETVKDVTTLVQKMLVHSHVAVRRAASGTIGPIIAARAEAEGGPTAALNDVFRTLKPAVVSTAYPTAFHAAHALKNLALAADGRFMPVVLSAVLQFGATRGLTHRHALRDALDSLTAVTASLDGVSVPDAAQRVRGLLEDNAASLLFDWCVKLGHQVEAFPAWLFGPFPTLTVLLSASSQDMVGTWAAMALLAHSAPDASPQATRSFSALADWFATTQGEKNATAAGTAFVKAHFARVLACLLVVQHVDQPAGQDRGRGAYAQSALQATEWLRVELGSAAFDELLLLHTEDIVAGVVQFADPSPADIKPAPATASVAWSPSLPFVAFPIVRLALDALLRLLSRASARAKADFTSPSAYLASCASDRGRRVLVVTAAQAARATTVSHRQRLQRALAAVVTHWMMGSHAKDGLTTHVLTVLVPLLAQWAAAATQPSHADLLATTLASVWRAAAAQRGDEVATLLPAATGALIVLEATRPSQAVSAALDDIATASECAFASSARWHLTNLRAIRSAARGMRGAAVSAFAVGSQLSLTDMADAGTSLTLADLIGVLRSLRGSEFGLATARLLNDVSAHVDANHSAFRDAAEVSPSHRTTLAHETVPWALALVRSGLATMDVRRAALGVLREVSVLLLRSGEPASFLTVLDSTAVPYMGNLLAAAGAEQALAATHASVLVSLAGLANAVDDLATARDATAVLTSALALPASVAAIRHLESSDPAAHAAIKCFRRDHGRLDYRADASSREAVSLAEMPALDSDTLWKTEAVTADGWTQRLAFALATSPLARDELLSLVARLAATSPALAAAVVPVGILVCALQSGREASLAALRAKLSKGITALLRDVATPLTIVRLLLRSVAASCAVHLAVVRTFGVRNAKQPAKAVGWVGRQPHTLRETLGFDVDPLVLAQAAARSGEPYHAEYFLQMACDGGDAGLRSVTSSYDFRFEARGAARSHRGRKEEAATTERDALRSEVARILLPLADALELSDVRSTNLGLGLEGEPTTTACGRVLTDSRAAEGTARLVSLCESLRSEAYWFGAVAVAATSDQLTPRGD